eukprot:Skav217132  [mRNA]  locus=scaffold427:42875:47240:+ [translate_table: standard]
MEVESPTVMGQIPRRPHVRISQRTLKEWKRGRRLNSAAKQRYLIRHEPSGRLTVWRRQWGQRNSKSKKSPALASPERHGAYPSRAIQAGHDVAAHSHQASKCMRLHHAQIQQAPLEGPPGHARQRGRWNVDGPQVLVT